VVRSADVLSSAVPTSAKNNAIDLESAKNLARRPAERSSVSVVIHAWLPATSPSHARRKSHAHTRSSSLVNASGSSRKLNAMPRAMEMAI